MYYSFDYFHRLWRPAIAWSYLVVCVFDFVLFPLLFGIFYGKNIELLNTWVPFSLRGGGLYHMAMLTIVGVTAWNRTQEKLQIVQSITNPANLSMPISTSNTTPSSP
jgi:hypothetical protein